MASIYLRGRRLYCGVKIGVDPVTGKSKFLYRPTPFNKGDEAKAQKFADLLEEDHRAASGGGSAKITVKAYAQKWLAERDGLASIGDDETRLRLHILPVIGDLALDEVRPSHLKALLAAMTKAKKHAPRTIRHIYSAIRNMFNDARGDEVTTNNPCVLRAKHKPKNVDKDPNWRATAIYTRQEVVMLMSDPRVIADRRVVYALKFFTGARHGEVARMRWRDYDPTLEFLGAIHLGKTKTGVPRSVPIHPALAQILGVWETVGWSRIYGREPTADDLLVPARTFSPRNKNDAGHQLAADLEMLGLRHRRGHDLRRSFISMAQEDGAVREMLETVTHGPKGDVMTGYTTFTWTAVCREVAKLRLAIPGWDPATFTTVFTTEETRVRKRWEKGLCPTVPGKRPAESKETLTDGKRSSVRPMGTAEIRETVVTLLQSAENAIRAGQTDLALEFLDAAKTDGRGSAPVALPRPKLRIV